MLGRTSDAASNTQKLELHGYFEKPCSEQRMRMLKSRIGQVLLAVKQTILLQNNVEPSWHTGARHAFRMAASQSCVHAAGSPRADTGLTSDVTELSLRLS